ncbi:DUF2817 domain-containing protein [Paraburkholderia sp. GAS42]|jgi:hypothetical protein|uniref:DUF2817 domain-containing protein n=1 Tax=Paraburkholderia sp. GAS42 TaxID=3035135 RepID=UPI003D1F2EBE
MASAFIETPSYADQRQRFAQAVADAGGERIEYPHPLKGPRGEALATDVALLGERNAPKRLVAISGTHGIEGYYGSECQIRLLHDLRGRELPKDVSIVLVHLVNPWGTAWMRRVNEDNVDVNRNYVNFDAALPANAAYETLHEIYLARDLDGPGRRAADELFATHARNLGHTPMMNIVEAGQYVHSNGLFFGGKTATWTNRTVRAIMKEHVAGARTAMSFDLHTGAGPFGYPLLMTIAERSYPAHETAQSIYGPWLHTIITAADATSDTGIAATATGYTSQALLDQLADVHLMQFVIECGTYDGHVGHAILRDDHWLHLHGDPLDATGRKIKAAMLEHFYPADADWRELTSLRTQQVWRRALEALAQI